ncbi:serine hydrolase domain-containing protein [Elizabethkingia meningoseptica]|uniref:serine hydrolase domain-containing protein n=1 Tax=Elizabethkingia meningoseptica TaxID=238 RepID=UPI0020129AA3|nr:serine hydrolase domain-containing protein [Elizabethkingia meningoseptica]MCL1674701.1 beta-lactamase family protein [Elizabethkingia meningoseptica]MCL1685931.1 beta-lactamase family protein [Elizabethkingia meningoseptica]
MLHKKLFSLLSFICIIQLITAQSFERKADSIIQKVFNDPNGPGGTFLVSKKGKPVYNKAFGKANIELNVNMTPDNVFQLGSMTKQFTAVAILMLEEQGKLKVTDPVSKYVPDYPSGDKITIHQLLNHTSGIKDFTRMKALSEISQKEMKPKMMVDFFKNEPTDFAPGEKFEYNNSGYVLLGYIIELVSGQTYEDFIKKNIFEKAGMNNSFYASDRKIIKNRAYGYHQKETGYVNKTIISFSVPFSSGSLMSTTHDMLKWQDALNRNILLKAENLQKAFSTYKLNNGTEFTYGYGWHIRDINGAPTREHGGSVFGFKTMGIYFPKQDIYVIGLSNCDCHSPTQVITDIAAQALKAFGK